MQASDYKQLREQSIRTASPFVEALFPKRDLADEVARLREEIAALRAELAPAKSVILTGQEVVRELRRLQGPFDPVRSGDGNH